jgi:hypothetical protein
LCSTTTKVTSSNGQVGTPDLFRGNSPGIETPFDRSMIYIFLSFIFLGYAKDFHLFFFFIAHFLLVKNTYKNPYSLKAIKYIRRHMFLKELVLCLNRTLWGQFLREICSPKNCTPFSCAVNGALA